MTHAISGLIALALLQSPPLLEPTTPPVLVGLDVLRSSNFEALKGKRVAVITNRTAIASDGRHLVDLLHEAAEVELVAIFTPEHGFRAEAEGAVSDTQDPKTGLPVYSLYGKRRKPTAEQLANVDVLVFDIQDIGCRFYTYISTMGLCMEAAGELGIPFVVLDRPNPISGAVLEGPVLDPGEESFVGYHTLPVRHGLTVGEIAELYRAERYPHVKLKVVRMKGWRRTMYFEDTGRRWVNPSPNMRSVRQAVLYPGIGLLETTNLSVGRGTDTPFELFGAPWLDAQVLWWALQQYRLPGVRFVPVRFQPKSSKYAGQWCEGLEVIVVDRARFRPVLTGLAIAHALRRTHTNQWDIRRFNRLLGDQRVYRAIERQEPFERIIQYAAADADAFKRRWASVLLYE